MGASWYGPAATLLAAFTALAGLLIVNSQPKRQRDAISSELSIIKALSEDIESMSSPSYVQHEVENAGSGRKWSEERISALRSSVDDKIDRLLNPDWRRSVYCWALVQPCWMITLVTVGRLTNGQAGETEMKIIVTGVPWLILTGLGLLIGSIVFGIRGHRHDWENLQRRSRKAQRGAKLVRLPTRCKAWRAGRQARLEESASPTSDGEPSAQENRPVSG